MCISQTNIHHICFRYVIFTSFFLAALLATFIEIDISKAKTKSIYAPTKLGDV